MFRFLAPLLLAGTAHAQCVGSSIYETLPPQDRASIEAAAAATPYGEGLTWRASRGDDVLTLIGTMHIYDPRLEALMPFSLAALDGAEVLLVELSNEDRSRLENRIATDSSLILLPEGQTLTDLVPEDVWADLSTAMTDRGMPAFVASRFQPWYLMLLLSIPPCAMSQMLAGQEGLDAMIMEEAERRGIPSQSLEPYDALFNIFSIFPLDEQIDMLSVGMIEPDRQTGMFVATLDDYFGERTAAVWELSKLMALQQDPIPGRTNEELFALFEDALLIQRNLRWIPVIEAAAEEHDTIFIAFGAAHLPGELGILRLLEQRGWTIEKLDR